MNPPFELSLVHVSPLAFLVFPHRVPVEQELDVGPLRLHDVGGERVVHVARLRAERNIADVDRATSRVLQNKSGVVETGKKECHLLLYEANMTMMTSFIFLACS